MKYARVLLGHCPEETTRLFISFYTGKYRPKKDVEPASESETSQPSALRNLAAFIPLPYVGRNDDTKKQPFEPQPPTDSDSSDDNVIYEIPKPRSAFSAFVDHPVEFITFLESLISQSSWSEQERIDLYTTLFEMYLGNAQKSQNSSVKSDWETKAKNLIEGKDVSIAATTENCVSVTK